MSQSSCVLSTQLPQHRLSNDPSAKPQYNRDLAKATMKNCFHPRIWEAQDFVSASSPKPKEVEIQEETHSELKNEVRKLLLAAKDPFKELDLVDKIQQLGVAYHFESEIEDKLQRLCNYQNFDQDSHADLYYISLRFRLLRQAGFHVSPDVFNKYKDEKGDFQASLASDVLGMLSLYEASFLSIHGEGILDDARDFTTKHLMSQVDHLSHPLGLQVQRALFLPLWYGVERVQARHYISIYEEDKSRIETLLEFAKLDFNIVQSLHRKELLELSGWWDKLLDDVRAKLPFPFRDRLVEGYAICMGINSEPQFSLGRIHITKIWSTYTIFDDAHDMYEDVEELRPLYDAVQRWDDTGLKLEDHFKVVFQEMTNLLKEIEVDMIRKRHFIGIPYMKKMMQFFAKYQFEEAEMMSSEDMPTFEKCLSLMPNSTGIDSFLVAGVMNLGELATKEVFDWIDSRPKLLDTYALLTRFLDDIADIKVEKDRISTVTCYMNEQGVPKEEAIQAIQQMINSLWKDMNKALLRPTHVPRPVLNIMFGVARNIAEFYTESGGDGYTDSSGRTKELVTLLLRDPIII